MKNIYVKNLFNKEPTKDISSDDLLYKIPLSTSKKKRLVKIDDKIIFGSKNIPIIAGPNGVENERLMVEVARELKKNNLHIIRGHAYKPLTFPYRSKTYKESGLCGMKIMENIKKEFGLKVVTEVTEIRFLDIISKTADILQIGSRNMQNLELLREVALRKKPVILKRHFGASLRDFLGAAEHILIEGNFNLILCERGVSVPHTHRATSRYALDIQAIPALKEISSLPIISDPSHASFWAPWVPSLAYASLAAGCDGLIIEVHPNPRKSLVDPLQALNFKNFNQVILKSKKIANVFKKKII
jgi:3-deoxy-7-phosphoheptulonate synthase